MKIICLWLRIQKLHLLILQVENITALAVIYCSVRSSHVRFFLGGVGGGESNPLTVFFFPFGYWIIDSKQYIWSSASSKIKGYICNRVFHKTRNDWIDLNTPSGQQSYNANRRNEKAAPDVPTHVTAGNWMRPWIKKHHTLSIQWASSAPLRSAIPFHCIPPALCHWGRIMRRSN